MKFLQNIFNPGKAFDTRWMADEEERQAHLYVIVTGMWGGRNDLIYLKEAIYKKKRPQDFVLVSTSNLRMRSYHGVDVCGNRLVREITTFIRQKERNQKNARISRISFVGFSAGGIFSRYAIGVLEEHGFFQAVRPDQYISIVSPHLGVRQSETKNATGRLLNRFVDATSNTMGGRTLDQLGLLDDEFDPLLLQMATQGSAFVQGLQRFRCTLYANARNDYSVPYCTAALATRNPYRRVAAREALTPLHGTRYIVHETVLAAGDPEKADAALPEPRPDFDEQAFTSETADVVDEVCFHGCLLPWWAMQTLLVIAPARMFAGEHDEQDTHPPPPRPFAHEGAPPPAARVPVLRPPRAGHGGRAPAAAAAPPSLGGDREGSLGSNSNSAATADESRASARSSLDGSGRGRSQQRGGAGEGGGGAEGEEGAPPPAGQATYQSLYREDSRRSLSRSGSFSKLTRKPSLRLKGMPKRIRAALLGSGVVWTRVDCWLPGVHTHRTICASERQRRFMAGADVMDNLADRVLGLPMGRGQEAPPPPAVEAVEAPVN